MSLMDQFQKLDDLILELTLPPVQTELRNQLALTREQIEAYQAASDNQDATLQRQAKAIAELQGENKRLVEQQSASLQNTSNLPFRVSDDFEFDTEGGFWVERKTRLRVCAGCLLPPTKIASPLSEAVGLGFDGEPALVWRCGNCHSDYFHKTPP
jgi:hypothetical protein